MASFSDKELEALKKFVKKANEANIEVENLNKVEKELLGTLTNIDSLTDSYHKKVESFNKKEKIAQALLAKAEVKNARNKKKIIAAKKKDLALSKELTEEEKELVKEQSKSINNIKKAEDNLKKVKVEAASVSKAFNPSNIKDKLRSVLKGALGKKEVGAGFRYIQDKMKVLERYERRHGVKIFDMKSLKKSGLNIEFLNYLDNTINDPVKKMGEDAKNSLVEKFEQAGNDISKKIKIIKAYARDVEISEAAVESKKHIEEVSGMRGGKLHKGAEVVTGMGSSLAGAGKSLFRGDQRGLSSAADQMSALGRASKGMGGVLGGIGKGLGALGDGLAALGKLNWVFALIGAVRAMISAVNELDKFMKALNQTFLELAGPSVGIGNVKDEMKRFNNEVFNLGRNVKLGLKGEEIQGLFKAMSGSGMSLQGVMKRVGSYGEAIEKARTMSLQFGVSFDKMGGDMTSQMIDLNSSLDDVAKNFNKLAFDASKAGISSDKFYQAVEASAMSLSFYGNNIKYVSGLLGDFYKTGNLAFKDAAKVTDTFATAFENMDENARRKFITLAGPEATSKAFEGAIVDAEKKRKSLEAEAIKDPSRKKEIQAQIDVTDALIRQLERAKGGSLGEQQVALPYITKSVMPMLMSALEGLGTGPGGEKMSLMAVAKSILPNLDQNTIFKGLIQQADITTIKYEKLNSELTENIRNNSKYSTQIRELTKQYESGKFNDFSVIKDKLMGLFKAAAPGATEEELSGILEATENNPSIILKGLKGDRAELVNDFISYIGTLNKGSSNLSEEGSRQLIGAITPLEKYAEITKEYLKFQIGDKLLSGILAATSESASHLGYLVEAGRAKHLKERDEAKKAAFATGNMPGVVSDLVRKLMAMENAGTQIDKDGNIAKDYEDIQNDLKKITSDKVTGPLAESYASNVRSEQMYIKDFYKRKWDLEKEEKSAQTDYEKGKIKEKQEAMVKEWDSRKTAKGALLDSVEGAMAVIAEKKARANSEKLTFKNLSLLQQQTDSSAGVANRVVGTMKPHAIPASGTAMTNQNNWGGININFNAPADSSNPSAYRNMLVAAIEQVWDRKMYEEKKKGG